MQEQIKVGKYIFENWQILNENIICRNEIAILNKNIQYATNTKPSGYICLGQHSSCPNIIFIYFSDSLKDLENVFIKKYFTNFNDAKEYVDNFLIKINKTLGFI